jgi:exocyst complex component 4
MAPYVAEPKRNYVFGGISSVAANASIKVCFEFAALPIFFVISTCY